MKAIYLRTERERQGLTQEQLETKSGVAQPIISRLERKPDANAQFDTVLKLAKALRIGNPKSLRFGPDPNQREEVAAS